MVVKYINAFSISNCNNLVLRSINSQVYQQLISYLAIRSPSTILLLHSAKKPFTMQLIRIINQKILFELHTKLQCRGCSFCSSARHLDVV